MTSTRLDSSHVGKIDEVAGRYTEADPQHPSPRSIAGEYTRTALDPDPEPDYEGSYVGSEAHPSRVNPHGPFGHYAASGR